MKINKILAAGVAATLAVTSLSAVASAEVKSIEFPMDYTVAKVQWNNAKIQWLGDNDYIGGAGYGAAYTCKTVINTYLSDAASLLAKNVIDATAAAIGTPATAKGDFADVLAATKKTIIDTAAKEVSDYIWGTGKGAGASTAAWAITDAEVTSAIKANAKNFTNAIIAAVNAATAAKAGADEADESIYSAEKTLGDLKTLVEKLTVADEALDNLIALQANAATATPAAITTLATNLDAAIVEAKAQLRLAEDALIGAPLLEDEELGGIQISTVAQPLVAGTTGYGAKFVQVTGAKLTIKGTKRGSTQNESWSGDFQQAYNTFNADHSGATKADALYLAFAPKYVNRPAYINLNVFGTITDVEIDISYKLLINEGTAANRDLKEAAYYSETDYDANKKVLAKALRDATAIKLYDELDIITETFDLAANDADWKTTYTALADPTTNLYKMYKALANSVLTDELTENSNSKITKYAFVKKTQNEGQTIFRQNVEVMSVTGAWNSLNQNSQYDYNQTYKDNGMGTGPREFGGLASQAADFFNKQNNGQMIFHFVDPAKVTTWTSNGIPSTEVGLRTALAQTAFALFFNYAESTGSIQTIGTVDKEALTVTFDMEDVLADFGGLTKANLHDIYYGCNNGLTYGDPYNDVGYAVDKVTFQYDDAPAAVDANTDDDAAADDDAAVVVADDDDDDDVVADDDDDDIAADDDIIEDDDDDDDDSGEIIADDDDDDDDVNNDVDYVDADDDANPGTGVGLAVIPAIVAGAALVVSKKRK